MYIFEINKSIMRRILLPFFIFLLFIQSAWAQTSVIDSLKSLIDNATSDSARIHATISYAKELTYNNPKECIRLLSSCIDESKKIGYKTGEADALFTLAVPYTLDAKYETSLKYWIESSKIYQQIGNRIGYANCLKSQGNIYYFMNEFSKAQENYEKALAIYKKENYYIGIAGCISNLGLVCQMTNHLEKALEYQKEGLNLEQKTGNKRGIAISHISISSVLLDMKRFDEAKKHALISIQYSNAIADTNEILDGMLRLADCYRLTGQHDSTQYYLEEIIRNCDRMKNLRLLAYALDIQTQLFDSLGFFHSAFISQKRLIAVKDSLLNKEKTAQLFEMQTKFETEQKEKENLILTSKNFKQKLLLWGLVLIIAFVFFLALEIYFSRKKLRVSHKNLLIFNQEVQQQKEEIETQAENLSKANEAIIHQKDQIENNHQKISDSIIYASFIQAAMLPSEEMLSNFSADNFVLYKPRDVVSGDFYWFKEKNGSYILAIADCTGHGVPGALLSMMGISFLNDIVANSTEIKVSKILDDLRHNVKLALGQFSKRNLIKEGIEIGLFCYNPEQETISFSGAHLSLWLLRNDKIVEFKSDRMPIGTSPKEKPFTTTEFTIGEDDIIYLFTDGIADQIGGPNGKKLLRKNFLNQILNISSLPLAEQKIVLEKNHENWRGNKFDQIDDILVMGIKFK